MDDLEIPKADWHFIDRLRTQELFSKDISFIGVVLRNSNRPEEKPTTVAMSSQRARALAELLIQAADRLEGAGRART